MWEAWVRSLGWEDPLEKGKAIHSSILAWRIAWTVESMGLQRVEHYWATFTFTHAHTVLYMNSWKSWGLWQTCREQFLSKDIKVQIKNLHDPRTLWVGFSPKATSLWFLGYRPPSFRFAELQRGQILLMWALCIFVFVVDFAFLPSIRKLTITGVKWATMIFTRKLHVLQKKPCPW